MRRTAVASAVGAAGLALAAGAHAAPVWLAAKTLGISVERNGNPQIAVNAAGQAVSVFERYDGQRYTILGAVRTRALGAWRVQPVSGTGGDAFNPQGAVDRAGNALAVWQQVVTGGGQAIHTAVRPARAAAWRDVRTLSAQGCFNVDLAGNRAGAAVAAWQRFVAAGQFAVQAALRRPDGTWTTPQDVSRPGENAGTPRVDIDDAGNAVVVWHAGPSGRASVQAAVSLRGAAWSAPQTLSAAGQNAQDPRVDVGPSGDAVAVWRRTSGADTFVETAGWRLGQTPAGVQVLTQPGQQGRDPDVAVGGAGRAVAVWRAAVSGNFVVQASVRPPSAGFGTAVTLSQPREDSSTPRASLDAAGNAVAAWTRSDGTNDILQAATLPAGALRWLAVQNVTPPGGTAVDPQVALGGGGRGVAVFVRSAGARWLWQAVDHLVSAPARGLVERAYVAAFRRGPPVARLRGRRSQIWAYFTFLVQPRPGQRITVTWRTPSGRVAGSVDKPRARVIETSVVGVNLHLQRGIWRAVLRVGGVRVGEARVRVG